MARKYSSKSSTSKKNRKGKTTYGKPFSKKNSSGKFRKGTKIQYKYVNGRRVGARKARK